MATSGFAVEENDQTARLQVWLDRQNFGPGKIDGKGGEFTSKAADQYRQANNKENTDNDALLADFNEDTFLEYQIKEEDIISIGKNATTREEQAKQKSMPYNSVLEMVAERFHSDTDYIRALNQDKNLESLKAGDTIRVPNVIPFEIASLKEEKLKPQEELSNRSIKIDTQERLLTVLEGEKVTAVFPITPGSENLPAPPGTWKVEMLVTLPPFRWDKKMLKEGERSEDAINLPPGPRNPAGILWTQLNKKGIGIHGTDDPESIGRSASHGCIRLANWDAAKLAGMITEGVQVVIK